MIATYLYGTVDEQGRTTGFEYEGDAGSFGCDLDGEEVTLDDGRTATVDEVYSHIQTAQWASNFVAVRLSVDSE